MQYLEHFKELLERNNLTGWECFPIEIEGYEKEYYAFYTISKSGGILNLEAVNNYETENRDFDIKTWDFCDVFTLDETLIFACTAKFKDIVEKTKITNIEFSPL